MLRRPHQCEQTPPSACGRAATGGLACPQRSAARLTYAASDRAPNLASRRRQHRSERPDVRSHGVQTDAESGERFGVQVVAACHLPPANDMPQLVTQPFAEDGAEIALTLEHDMPSGDVLTLEWAGLPADGNRVAVASTGAPPPSPPPRPPSSSGRTPLGTSVDKPAASCMAALQDTPTARSGVCKRVPPPCTARRRENVCQRPRL